MVESEFDEFGVTKIYRSSRDPKRAKPWLLGIGDWKSRNYDWDGEITSRMGQDGFLILNIKNYKKYYDENNIERVGDKDGRGRKPVLALPIDQYPKESETQTPIIVTEKNQRTLRKRGYMGTPADWKNVEITLYAKVNDVGAEAGQEVGKTDKDPYIKQLVLGARGGPRHSNAPVFGDPCQGSSYYTVLNLDGNGVVVKELFHDNGYCAELIGTTHGKANSKIADLHSKIQGDHSIASRWIGMKGIFYTNENGNPQLELWVDENNTDEWRMLIDIEDRVDDDDFTISNYSYDKHGWFLTRPEYPPDTPPIFKRNQCGGEANERITWGGPAAKFRWDYITNVDITHASIREIVPPEMSLRNLLKTNRISIPVDISSVGQFFNLPFPISVRDLAERLL